MMAQNHKATSHSSLLRKLFFLSAIIVIANVLIGIFARVTKDTDDEIHFLDTLWRVVVGQRMGIDFHYPVGFGPYQVGALLWNWLGPHRYVMWLAITLFNLSIAFCGCIVAERTLARRSNLALLFCVTLAFQVSAPTMFSSTPVQLGMTEYYNRHIASALAVLFLQTFAASPAPSMRENKIEVILAACLLNIMFLTKISGLILGLLILIAGCLLQGRTIHRLLNLCAVVLAFTAITTIEFKVTGLELLPIIRDYQSAALAQNAKLAAMLTDFHRLVLDVMSGPLSPLVSSVVLLVLFAVSQRSGQQRLDGRRTGLVIISYAGCQFALNMTNTAYPNMWLAPAAIASLVACMGAKPAVQQMGSPENWWHRIAPSRLAEITAREAIPLVIFVFVLVPQIMSSIAGVAAAALFMLRIEAPYVVTAGKGVSFSSFHGGAYERSLNDAVTALSSLNLGREAIANLDYANPFPVLFLAPPPKGIQVSWAFGNNFPRDALLGWQDVIGDACIVTIPVLSSDEPEVTARLVNIVRPKLATDFKLVYQDASWSIYRRVGDCAAF
jgi:hypothetical protein